MRPNVFTWTILTLYTVQSFLLLMKLSCYKRSLEICTWTRADFVSSVWKTRSQSLCPKGISKGNNFNESETCALYKQALCFRARNLRAWLMWLTSQDRMTNRRPKKRRQIRCLPLTLQAVRQQQKRHPPLDSPSAVSQQQKRHLPLDSPSAVSQQRKLLLPHANPPPVSQQRKLLLPHANPPPVSQLLQTKVVNNFSSSFLILIFRWTSASSAGKIKKNLQKSEKFHYWYHSSC